MDQNQSYQIRVDMSIHLTSKFNLDVKTGSMVGYVFRIDDGQADYAYYADFPITNIRVVAWCFGMLKTCFEYHNTLRIHVWNIYLHWDYFKLHTGVNVGKYSSTMDSLG